MKAFTCNYGVNAFSKSNRLVVSSILTIFLFTLLMFLPLSWGTPYVYAKGNYDLGEKADKWVGTASKEIEATIQAGKTLMPKTVYLFGGGHNKTPPIKTVDSPDNLDCSSFTYWAYIKGAGVDLYGAEYTTWTVMKDPRTVKGKGWEEARRGDLVLTNNNEHIVIFLGMDNGRPVVMGCNGSNPSDGGVSIIYSDYTSPTGFLHMDDLIKSGKYTKAEDLRLKNLKVTSSKDSSDSKKDGDKVAVKGGGDMDESNIPKMPKKRDYGESNLPEQAKQLEGDELSQLVLWKQEYDASNEVKYIQVIRGVLMAIAIILILYAIAIVLCYVADRSMKLGVGLLAVITGGRLETSLDGRSTFKDKNAEFRLVNGKDVTLIVIVLVAISALLFSGSFYWLAEKLVRGVTSVIEYFKTGYQSK